MTICCCYLHKVKLVEIHNEPTDLVLNVYSNHIVSKVPIESH